MLRFALPVMVVASAVDAEIRYDEHLLPACFQGLASGAFYRCAMISAQHCVETSEGDQLTVMDACRQRELLQWEQMVDDRLDFLQSLESLADIVAPLQTPKPFPGGLEKALEEMDQTWQSYRESACAYTKTVWQDAPGAEVARLSCAIIITARYATDLSNMAQQRPRGFGKAD